MNLKSAFTLSSLLLFASAVHAAREGVPVYQGIETVEDAATAINDLADEVLPANGGDDIFYVDRQNKQVTVSTIAVTNTIAVSSPTYMRVYRNGALTIGNGAEVQVVFDTISEDYKSLYSVTTGSATIKVSGGYTIGMSIGFSAMQADVRLLGLIKVNGTNVWVGGLPASVSTDISVPPITWTIPLTAGDTVSWYVRHDSAAGKAIQTGLANCQAFILREW